MNYQTEDKLILDELLLLDEVDLYALHLRFRISPAQASGAVNRLSEAEILKLEPDATVSRSRNFVVETIRRRHKIFNRAQPWRYKTADQRARSQSRKA